MPKKPNDPKRHHYVPCVLLSRFGEGEGRDALIYVWDKQTGKVRRTNANDAAHENNLHRIPDEDYALIADSPNMRSLPERYQGVLGTEYLFADIEGMLGELLTKMTTRLHMPERGSEDWLFLLYAFVHLWVRTPAKMEEVRVMMELDMNMLAQLEVNRSDNPDREAPLYELPYKENRHILLANSMLHMQPLVEVLAQRHWSLLSAPLGTTDFILTDYPVAYSFARGTVTEFDVAAPAVKNTLATLPLARNLLLVGEYETPSGVRLANDRWVGYHNNIAFTKAERFLFTHQEHFVCLTDFIERRTAYPSVNGTAEQLVTITPDIFQKMHEQGAMQKPVRMTVNGQLPQDFRLT